MPKNSSNPHYFCPCDKKQYLGVDATRLLGFVALNLKLAEGYTSNTIPDAYRPNHHVFYDDRVVDVIDGLPKWKTVLEGQLLPEKSDNNLPLADQNDIRLSLTRSNPNATQRGTEWLGSSDGVNGKVRKDVLPLSPVRPVEQTIYHFPEVEFPANNFTKISDEMIQKRVKHKYYSSPGIYIAPSKQKRDAIIIGGGHNGLVCAAYLAKNGVDALVLERRNIIGGAAVTEEIIPGFKFSRASYLAGLLRPQIIKDLELEKYGFKYLPRNPSSCKCDDRSLYLKY
jgi:hypothetical protein